MGYKRPLDYNRIHHEIYLTGIELNSPYNDGFTSWEHKKDLYKIKFLVDAILKDSPEFTGEEEFLKEHEKELVWRSLKQ